MVAALTACLVAANARGGPTASRPAILSTVSAKSESGTTWLTSPAAYASWAVIISASSAIRIARARPTAAATVIVEPPSGISPMRENASRNDADSWHTARSAAKQIDAPTPAAMPLTAATTGFRSPTMLRVIVLAPSMVRSSKVSTGLSPVRSAPALNARPDPVTTTTRTESSRPADSSACTSPTAISSSRALNASGRLSVTQQIPASVSTCRCPFTAVPSRRPSCTPPFGQGGHDLEVAVGPGGQRLLERPEDLRILEAARDPHVRSAADRPDPLASDVVRRHLRDHLGLDPLLEEHDEATRRVGLRERRVERHRVVVHTGQLGGRQHDAGHLEAAALLEQLLELLLHLGLRPHRRRHPDVPGLDIGLHVGETGVLEPRPQLRHPHLALADVHCAEERDERRHRHSLPTGGGSAPKCTELRCSPPNFSDLPKSPLACRTRAPNTLPKSRG